MSNKTISAKEIDDMTSIERYIEMLLDEYPNAISQTELAQKTEVTKSAISKVRDKVVGFCDLEILGHKKKLLLSLDRATFWKLLFFFVNRLKPQVFFASNYLRAFIEKMDIHRKLSEQLSGLHYSDYFDKDDTNKFIEIALHNLSAIKIARPSHGEMNRTKRGEVGSLARYAAYIPVINDIISKFDAAIFADEEDLAHLLKLRDKVFYFVIDNAERLLQNWEVLKDIKSKSKKAAYVEAYVRVVDFYMRKFSGDFSSIVAKRAEEAKIEFRKEYFKIGSFFRPGKASKSDISPPGQEKEVYRSNPGFGGSPVPGN